MYAAFITVPGFRPVMLHNKYSPDQAWDLINAKDKKKGPVLAKLTFSIPTSDNERFLLKLVFTDDADREALSRNATYWARMVGQYLLDAHGGPGDTITHEEGEIVFSTPAKRLWDGSRTAWDTASHKRAAAGAGASV